MITESQTGWWRFLRSVSAIKVLQKPQISYACFFSVLYGILIAAASSTVYAEPPDDPQSLDALSDPFPDFSEDEAEKTSNLDHIVTLQNHKPGSDETERGADENAVDRAHVPTDDENQADADLSVIGGSDEFSPISAFRPSTTLSEGSVPKNTRRRGFLNPGNFSLELPSDSPRDRLMHFRSHHYFYHAPLYFEDAELERCGRSYGVFQPLVSGAHFFGTLPLVPYKMAQQPPTHAVLSLGDCPTWGRFSWRDNFLPPFSGTASLIEAGAIIGVIFLIP